MSINVSPVYISTIDAEIVQAESAIANCTATLAQFTAEKAQHETRLADLQAVRATLEPNA